MRVTIWILSIIVLAVIAVGGYYSMRIGLVGGSYLYYQCEHGYATYPYGVTDSANTYYDSTGKQVGVCNSWIAGPSCEPAKKIVGECDKEGVIRWSLFYKQFPTENFENIPNPKVEDVEILSVNYPSVTYRVNKIADSNAWLRIIDVPSGLSMWQKSEIAVGTHEINLASLELPYESRKISLAAGTYRLRLEVFVGGIGKTLAESGTFTVPGTVVAVPTCTIRLNASTLTWTSQNADEAFIAHSPGMGGSPIILGLNRGKKVSPNGSEAVTWDGAAEESWLVVKNARGATVCYPNGTTYFNSQKEIDNPPTMG